MSEDNSKTWHLSHSERHDLVMGLKEAAEVVEAQAAQARVVAEEADEEARWLREEAAEQGRREARAWAEAQIQARAEEEMLVQTLSAARAAGMPLTMSAVQQPRSPCDMEVADARAAAMPAAMNAVQQQYHADRQANLRERILAATIRSNAGAAGAAGASNVIVSLAESDMDPDTDTDMDMGMEGGSKRKISRRRKNSKKRKKKPRKTKRRKKTKKN
mgnify:CR=1 FL=1